MRVATDIGGTFTDLVAVDDQGKTILTKSHTTPPNFEEGVIKVIQKSGVCPQEIKSLYPRDDDDHQCADRAEGSKDGTDHHKGIPGCAGDRQMQPAGSL